MHPAIQCPNQQRSLASLSDEDIERILSFLDWRHLLKCRLVCKALRSSVDKNPTSQYAIELAVAGMEDGARSHHDLTAASKLALLKERNACWDTLKWGEVRDLPLLRGDIIWELCGGVFAQCSLPGALRLHRLPSQCRNIAASSWRVPLLPDTKDFTMDPAQDLLVLLEKPILVPTQNGTKSHIQIQIHLRSVTTGHVHPSVDNAVIIRNINMRSTQMDVSLQVSGDLLGCLFVGLGNNTPELTVWKWKTGELILTRSSREIATFIFLNSHLLLVGAVMNEIEVVEPRLFVIDMSKPSAKKLTLTAEFLCAFEFPPFDPVVSPIAISIHSDPSPNWNPSPEAPVPFSIARAHRLFAITTWVQNNRDKVSYDLFVQADVLVRHVKARWTRRDIINWDEWGPTDTRFVKSLPHSHWHVWTGYVFGSKFVSLVTSPKTTAGPQSQTLEVWDFNKFSMKRAAITGFENENIRHIYDTTIVNDEVFVKTIRTSLPYSVTTRTLPPPRSPEGPTFTDAMCCEDTLLLVDNSDSDYRRLRILTF